MRKVVFLDRDGVVNLDPGDRTETGYVATWEDFSFLPGAVKAVSKLTRAGLDSVIISNQQGVGKDLFTLSELENITDKMMKAFKKEDGDIKRVYYCTHLNSEGCSCRKPGTGLFKRAMKELSLEPQDVTYYIGDTQSDIIAGKKAGLRTILVLSGKTEKKDVINWSCEPDHIFDGLLQAAEFIIEKT